MFVAAACPTAAAVQEAPATTLPDVDFARDVAPLLAHCCADCHGGAEPAAKLSFDPTWDEQAAARNVSLWLAVRDKLRCDAMPPPEVPRPDATERANALRWLETRLGTGLHAWPIDPGRTTIRRLNRVEYANSVRDLFGVDLVDRRSLPPDESGYGFDVVADVLSVSPSLLERYVEAAEVAAELALPSLERRRRQPASTPPEKSEQAFYVCGDDPDHGRACVAPLFERFASRAWRRPATVPEVARLVALFDAAIAAGDDFTAATRQCVVAVLSSPKFLFRLEVDAKPDDAKAAHALDDFELASRLSYFLWSSLPDDRLEEAARRRRLAEPATLVAETRRMLADPRADTLVTQFAAQWLDLNGIDDVEPDRALFHHFDLGLRLAMRQETELFVRAVFFESRPLATLVDADFTFVNDRLARFYGIADVKGSAMRRVALSPGRRGGVLTQASLLTLTSTPSRTSPTKRGRLVLERFLGTPPKPPPPGVGALDESSADVRGLPIAQRLARHRRDPTCAACHAAIDPLGLALEDFDPIGRARAHVEVDASLRQLPDGTTLDGAASLKALVLRRDLFTRCFARKLDTFALGRGLGEDDLRAVDAAVDSFGGRSPTLEELVVALVQLDSFRRRRGEAPDVAVGGR